MATYTSNFPDLLEPWVTQIFFNEYDMLPTEYDQIFNVKSSTRYMEDTFNVAGLGDFRAKPEGTAISYDDPVQSLRKRIVHTTFSNGFRVTMEMMADDQHNIISKMPSDLSLGARDHKETLAFSLFNDAFTGSFYTGIPEGDGTARSLCNTQHVHLKAGGPSSNRASPGVAFSISGLEAAITNLRLTQDESGRQIVLRPKEVLHHPNDEFNVAQILENTEQPYTADRNINTVSRSRMGITSRMSPFLTDTDAWFLLCAKSQHTLTWYNRMELTFGSNKDAQTKDALFDAMYRASVTFENWRGVYGSNP
jgi:hypothetical protein